MKKKLLLLSCVSLLSFSSCDDNITSDSSLNDNLSNNSNEIVTPVENDILLNETYDDLKPLTNVSNDIHNWSNTFVDNNHGFNHEKIKYSEAYKNNILTNGEVSIGTEDDVKYVFYDNNHARFISNADGYAFTLPTNVVLKNDFSLGKYRSKLYNSEYTITISNEHSNPYVVNGWDIYRREWLFRYLDNENYYSQNGLKALYSPLKNDTKLIPGYIIDHYDIMIDNPGQIKKNYYNVGVIRRTNEIKNFILLVMKSNCDMHNEFQEIMKSYKAINIYGKANNNSMLDLPISKNPLWDDTTKKYYDSLLNDNRTGWGAFVATLPDGELRDAQVLNSAAYVKLHALEEAIDYKFDILPTYQHLAWNRRTDLIFWPTTAAKLMGKGDGFNDLPVLQMSYQFTDNNNNVSVFNTTDCYTPMFDLYRGDDQGYNTPRNNYYNKLVVLAKHIKEYGAPVLFRLNNEMNTDWTSYCGMMTLLDPDIFQATWRLLYNIFKENGVTNAIWIFNPMAKSCPYSSWGEDLCYYPGIEYVNALGLTYYENNNDNKNITENTFREDYTELYEKNNPVWNKYPWIISEFACGSGGDSEGKERYRNQASQVAYIKGMFADFKDRSNHKYLQNIKGAVWFSVNDYGTDEKGNQTVVNQLELEIEKLPLTIEAFKESIAFNKKQK